jgi:hypothetical protein
MTRDQLEHAIRAACDVAEDTEVYVFGSQAILGTYPDAPAGLVVSEEADISPRNRRELTDRVDALLGQDSQFHITHGFYVHGIPINEAATLPPGWEGRAVRVQNANTRNLTGWCLEGHDLAASKLVAFRDKDRDFVRLLLVEGLINPGVLRKRVAALPVAVSDRKRLRTWIMAVERG